MLGRLLEAFECLGGFWRFLEVLEALEALAALGTFPGTFPGGLFRTFPARDFRGSNLASRFLRSLN